MNMNNTSINIYEGKHTFNIISTYKVRTETKQKSLILSYSILLQTPYLAFMVAKLKSIF